MEKQYNYVFYPAVIFSAPLWGKDGTGGYGEHHQEDKTMVARARVAHGEGWKSQADLALGF